MADVRLFEEQRAHLARLAYQLLGSVGDAEDMVQETFVRWQAAGDFAPRDARAWFTTTCTRLCLDRLKSAQRQRREYVGEWLPEPLLATPAEDPRELDDAVSVALLVTLEALAPAERAAFLLHDVFGYEFAEVARILALKPAHCRQLAVRARARLRGREHPRAVDRAGYERLSHAFFAALRGGDLEGLQALLCEDVRFHADGGGKASAARRVLAGRPAVLRFLERAVIAGQREVPHEARDVWFNGAPGVVLYADGAPVSAFQFELAGERIGAIYVHRNPDKLAAFAGV
ncbi:MAG: RNA polymerase sigma factor SigJ [Planctomycetes bacterium]|nr:RNA polymerase sigma factor SigJ [Planctomycetota bacterium]